MGNFEMVFCSLCIMIRLYVIGLKSNYLTFKLLCRIFVLLKP